VQLEMPSMSAYPQQWAFPIILDGEWLKPIHRIHYVAQVNHPTKSQIPWVMMGSTMCIQNVALKCHPLWGITMLSC